MYLLPGVIILLDEFWQNNRHKSHTFFWFSRKTFDYIGIKGTFMAEKVCANWAESAIEQLILSPVYKSS